MRKGRESVEKDVKESVLSGFVLLIGEGVWKAGVLYKMKRKSPPSLRGIQNKGKALFSLQQTCFVEDEWLCICCHFPRWDWEQEIREGYRGVAEDHTASNQITGNHSFIPQKLTMNSSLRSVHSHTAASENISTNCWLHFRFMLTLLYCISRQRRTKKYCAASKTKQQDILMFSATR